jgi:DNA (cytosine-5)-methyltransferase 1
VAGGPPCQAFSQVRNHARLIDDPRNSLYSEFVAIVHAIAPRAFVMENVPGMAQMRVVEQFVDDLGCDGDYIVQPSVVDAADFGAPQTRKRIVFVGLRRDLRIEPPVLRGSGAVTELVLERSKTHRGYVVSARNGDVDFVDRLADPWGDGLVTVEQAIGDLTWLHSGHRDDDAAPEELVER